jgi:hypothetical protein
MRQPIACKQVQAERSLSLALIMIQTSENELTKNQLRAFYATSFSSPQKNWRCRGTTSAALCGGGVGEVRGWGWLQDGKLGTGEVMQHTRYAAERVVCGIRI